MSGFLADDSGEPQHRGEVWASILLINTASNKASILTNLMCCQCKTLQFQKSENVCVLKRR